MSIISKPAYNKKTGKSLNGALRRDMTAPLLLGILFFFIVCLGAPDSMPATMLIAAAFALIVTAMRFGVLRERICIPFLALALYVLMDGVSTFYALSGKFALREFLKVFLAFALALILLAASPKKEEQTGRRIATVLAVFAALSSLISIDMFSTRILSKAVFWILRHFTGAYNDLEAIETGIRMNSLFFNPNPFAGLTAVGILLSFGLAIHAPSRRERCVDLALLYITALGFLLAFSMGGCVFLALAFLVFLILEQKENRVGLFLLALETAILVAISAALISMTSFQNTDRVQLIPLACALLGAAAICALDIFAVSRLAEKLRVHGRLIWIVLLVLVVLAGGFAALAWNLTDALTLEPGETVSRSAYPSPGDYSLDIQADGPVYVGIYSQNRQDAMMHTNSQLYNGDAADAVFTVPEDSMVVYFVFGSPEKAVIRSAAVGSEKIPLHYKLLPGFIANRLQGMRANQNVIQRFVFFEDGLKLFGSSPVWGLGIGSFESALKSVQSFYYETKYVHNHYIQTLLETGVIGLVLFLAVLLTNAVAIWKSRKRRVFAPMLGAALVFMAGHATMEFDFSNYSFLAMAFGTFAVTCLCCGDAMEKPKLSKLLKTVSICVIALCTAVYCFFIAGNLMAKQHQRNDPSTRALVHCVELDRFEWADYALTYVIDAIGENTPPDMRQQADEYAERLSKVSSSTMPIYLAEYYFNTDRTEQAIAMVERYVDYSSSDQLAWDTAFGVLQAYENDSAAFRNGVIRICEKLERWNAENLGDITISPEVQEFIDQYQG